MLVLLCAVGLLAVLLYCHDIVYPLAPDIFSGPKGIITRKDVYKHRFSLQSAYCAGTTWTAVP